MPTSNTSSSRTTTPSPSMIIAKTPPLTHIYHFSIFIYHLFHVCFRRVSSCFRAKFNRKPNEHNVFHVFQLCFMKHGNPLLKRNTTLSHLRDICFFLNETIFHCKVKGIRYLDRLILDKKDAKVRRLSVNKYKKVGKFGASVPTLGSPGNSRGTRVPQPFAQDWRTPPVTDRHGLDGRSQTRKHPDDTKCYIYYTETLHPFRNETLFKKMFWTCLIF